jgi:DNA-binding MarR family transcriptional regulator
MQKDLFVEKIIILNKNIKKLFDKSVDDIAKQFDLTKSELFILSIISYDSNVFNSCDIVKQHHFSKAYVSQSITSLKNKRYIKLIKNDNDKRCQKIELLDKSEEIIKCLKKQFLKNINIIKKDINEKDLILMISIIDKIINNIDENKEVK